MIDIRFSRNHLNQNHFLHFFFFAHWTCNKLQLKVITAKVAARGTVNLSNHLCNSHWKKKIHAIVHRLSGSWEENFNNEEKLFKRLIFAPPSNLVS